MRSRRGGLVPTDTLVARLWVFPAFFPNGSHWMRGLGGEPLCLEAADRIEALEATIRVQEAQIESLQREN